jgi:hypothetical protein
MADVTADSLAPAMRCRKFRFHLLVFQILVASFQLPPTLRHTTAYFASDFLRRLALGLERDGADLARCAQKRWPWATIAQISPEDFGMDVEH